jgi:hypothetical protein
MEYESPITYNSKDMANVKVFADRQMVSFDTGGIKKLFDLIMCTLSNHFSPPGGNMSQINHKHYCTNFQPLSLYQM